MHSLNPSRGSESRLSFHVAPKSMWGLRCFFSLWPILRKLWGFFLLFLFLFLFLVDVLLNSGSVSLSSPGPRRGWRVLVHWRFPPRPQPVDIKPQGWEAPDLLRDPLLEHLPHMCHCCRSVSQTWQDKADSLPVWVWGGGRRSCAREPISHQTQGGLVSLAGAGAFDCSAEQPSQKNQRSLEDTAHRATIPPSSEKQLHSHRPPESPTLFHPLQS